MYHCFQFPALSLATSSTACRCGSNANRMRISLDPVEDRADLFQPINCGADLTGRLTVEPQEPVLDFAQQDD